VIRERVIEGSWVPPWVRYQHVARYQWVATKTVGCKVIDAACGTGYGCRILLDRGARQVDGFDLSQEAVEAAKRGRKDARLHFEVADVTHLPVPDGSYDVFVALETIEHIEDDRAFLAEAVRVLKPGGRFICSTPNRAITNPGAAIGDRPFNPYHVREYTAPELEALLRLFFREVVFWGQSRYSALYAGVLAAIGRRLPQAGARLHQACKLLGIPWERPERHWPSPLAVGGTPEILIASCTL
jgi:SAM-dependent methyltransferase